MSHSGVSSVSEAAPLAQTQTKATCKPSTRQDGPVLRQGENPAAYQDEQRPPKGRSTSYPLETRNVTSSRKKAFANFKFRISRRDHPTVRVARHPMAGVLCRGEGGERLRGRRPVRTDAGHAGTRPPAKAGRETPGAGRGKAGP